MKVTWPNSDLNFSHFLGWLLLIYAAVCDEENVFENEF